MTVPIIRDTLHEDGVSVKLNKGEMIWFNLNLERRN